MCGLRFFVLALCAPHMRGVVFDDDNTGKRTVNVNIGRAVIEDYYYDNGLSKKPVHGAKPKIKISKNDSKLEHPTPDLWDLFDVGHMDKMFHGEPTVEEIEKYYEVAKQYHAKRWEQLLKGHKNGSSKLRDEVTSSVSRGLQHARNTSKKLAILEIEGKNKADKFSCYTWGNDNCEEWNCNAGSMTCKSLDFPSEDWCQCTDNTCSFESENFRICPAWLPPATICAARDGQSSSPSFNDYPPAPHVPLNWYLTKWFGCKMLVNVLMGQLAKAVGDYVCDWVTGEAAGACASLASLTGPGAPAVIVACEYAVHFICAKAVPKILTYVGGEISKMVDYSYVDLCESAIGMPKQAFPYWMATDFKGRQEFNMVMHGQESLPRGVHWPDCV